MASAVDAAITPGTLRTTATSIPVSTGKDTVAGSSKLGIESKGENTMHKAITYPEWKEDLETRAAQPSAATTRVDFEIAQASNLGVRIDAPMVAFFDAVIARAACGVKREPA